MEKVGQETHMTAGDVKRKVGDLMERRRWLRDGGEPPSPGVNLPLEITKEFEALSAQIGVSVAALEFLHNPIGLVGSGANDLTPVEKVLEDVNVELAQELHLAGLL